MTNPAGSAGTADAGGAAGAPATDAGAVALVNVRFDWTGVVGTGQGFELRDGGAARLAISSVEIDGDVVHITSAADLPGTVTVGYAMSGDASEKMATPFAGAVHWGRLRDSDPFVGATTEKVQPNFAVAFELPVPNG